MKRTVSVALSKIVTELESVLWIRVVPEALIMLPGGGTATVFVTKSVEPFTTFTVPEVLSDTSNLSSATGVGVAVGVGISTGAA